MRERRRGHNVKTTWALILLALVYCGWLYFQRTLTGNNKLDGSIGVLLGLFISAHPAANLLDMVLFAGSELPICCFYTDHVRDEDVRESTHAESCLIGNLNRVREGFPFVYDATTPGCAGGKRYTGFTQKLRPRFEYFLSCGIPGEMEGERYRADL